MSKYKFPESDHWLKQGSNHVMANRTRMIEKRARFAIEEQADLLRIFATVFAEGITRSRKVFDEPIVDQYLGTFGELLFEQF